MSSIILDHKELLHRVSIPQKVQFHVETVELIKDEAAKVDALTDLVAEYESDTAELNAAYNESLKSIETEEMVLADDSRDAITAETIRRVNFAYNKPATDVEKQKAHELLFEIEKYQKTVRKDYKSETTAVRKLVADMRTHADAVTTLNLSELLDRLEAENNTFEQLSLSRTEALESKRERGPVGSKAEKTNRTFDFLCTAAAGLYVAKTTTVVKAALNEIISDLNGQIHAYTTIYHRHAGIVAKHRKDKDKEKEDNGTQTPGTDPPTDPPTDHQNPDTSLPTVDPEDLGPSMGERMKVKIEVTEVGKEPQKVSKK